MKEMKGLKKYIGLILSEENSEPIVFNMDKPCVTSIHSCLCPPFVAHWYLGNKKIGEEYVKPGQLRIDPPGEYDKLIEVPCKLKEEKEDGIK